MTLDRLHVDEPSFVDHDSRPYLVGGVWSVRPAVGSSGRAALEVYADGALIDVMVAASLGCRLLRGGRAAHVAGRPCSVAWGCLPSPRDEAPAVDFTRGGLRTRTLGVTAVRVADWFWVAAADGMFSRAVATGSDRRETCEIWRTKAC